MNETAKNSLNNFIIKIKDIENVETDNKHCICALLAVEYIQEYLEFEEESCNCTQWVDKKGYSFKTDIGYFFEGLEDFEKCLIQRLRSCRNE